MNSILSLTLKRAGFSEYQMNSISYLFRSILLMGALKILIAFTYCKFYRCAALICSTTNKIKIKFV